MKPMFSPSLMCMDFLDIKNQIEVLNTRADLFHADIMDGHFVKNITLSPDFVSRISKITKLPIDCHLMVTNPEQYINDLADAGATYICPHSETINGQAFRLFKQIRDVGCKVGVILNPETPLSYISEYIHLVDKITIMTVDPGFAGQPFIKEMLHKIRQAKELKEQKGYKYLIEVDGSCNKNTFKDLYNAGAEIFIVGSSGLFNLDPSLTKAWDKMIEDFEKETGN